MITPEMSAKILDESHFKFHVECKAKIVNAVNKLGKGIDFLKSLSQLKFSTDKRWTKNTCKDPNVAALLGILEDYKKLEHRPSRAKILVPIIEYAIGLYASDLFYRERGEWFLMQIMARAEQFRFYKCFADPENWYPIERCPADYQKYEENNPTIEEEYILWYGVDPRKDECVISYDMTNMQKMIADQKKWVEENCGTKWAEEELSRI